MAGNADVRSARRSAGRRALGALALWLGFYGLGFAVAAALLLLPWMELQYQGEIGKYNVKFERDERAAARTGPIVRKAYRFQVQGPNAMKTMEKVLGKTPPDLKFFNMTTMTIAGKKVRALRHGMAGQPGFELFGPWEDGDAVKAAIVEAGKDFGLVLVGNRAYATNTLESGWIPSPLPAVYTGEKMKAYRE